MSIITLTALGTTWWVEVFDDIDAVRLSKLQQSINELLLSVEVRFSRFKDDSLVGTLNKHRRVVSNDKDLITLIRQGQRFYKETNGAFNILIGDALLARGYDKEYSLAAMERVVEIGNPLVDLDYTNDTWHINAGILDLGGIGKGWAIDEVAKLLQETGVTEFLINGGGDMYGTSEHGEAIEIYLEHPTITGTFLGRTHIKNQGFAASSHYKRRWKTAQGETSHIVGEQPDIDASFVIATDSVTADVLATTALLLPPTSFAKIAEKYQTTHATYNIANKVFAKSPGFLFTQPND